MEILAAYVFAGIAVCALVAWSGAKSPRRDEPPLSILFDPVWPIIVLWPLWLVVVLVERSFPQAPRSSPSIAVDHVGQTAIVVTELRPVGRIQVGASQFDARSSGRIISAGSTVRIVSRSMAEFVVEEESTPGRLDDVKAAT